jgi:hypothetical protein
VCAAAGARTAAADVGFERITKAAALSPIGLDTDNDSVFMNETVRDYCEQVSIEFKRCRPYRKNDQAWVEQKNGAVVRRMIGYRRFEGLQAAAALARLYARCGCS